MVIFIGVIKRVIPKTNVMFAIFEHITLLNAISEDTIKAAYKLIISSGIDVDKETNDNPIIILQHHNHVAISKDASRRQLPPITSKTNTAINNKISRNMKFFLKFN